MVTSLIFAVFQRKQNDFLASIVDADENAVYKEYFTGERVKGTDLKKGLLFSAKNGKIAEIKYYVKEEN